MLKYKRMLSWNGALFGGLNAYSKDKILIAPDKTASADLYVSTAMG